MDSSYAKSSHRLALGKLLHWARSAGWQLNTDTVYRLIRQKKLPAAQIGRAYRIPREDVEVFLQAHSTSPQLRSALFRRVLDLAERNPGVDSDAVLEDLEAWDEEQKQQRSRAQPG